MKKMCLLFVALLLATPFAASAATLVGDVDGDGEVSIADVAKSSDYLLTDNSTGINLGNADVNQDGMVDISDVAQLIDYLMAGSWPKTDHEYVDLGLPSGTLWATCNVGASAPEEYGDYFAWGETAPKDYYDWSTYKWCNGSSRTLTKYCTDSSYGYNGFVDNKTELDPEDDAATVNWGPSWRMPTSNQYSELCELCTWEWVQRNGVNGRLVTGPNGKTLFLPAAGMLWDDYLYDAGSTGNYWSRTLYYKDYDADMLLFGSISWHWYDFNRRSDAQTVRAVRVSQN